MKKPETGTAKVNNQVNYGPFFAIFMSLLVYISAPFISGIIVVIYPILSGWSLERTGRWLNDSVFAQFLLVLGVELITFWAIRLFLKLKKTSFSSIGLIKPRLKDIGYALTGFAVYLPLLLAVIFMIQTLIPSLDVDQKQQLGFVRANSGLELALVFVSLVVLPAFVEELVTRGFLYSGLKTRFPRWLAAVITSLLFAIVHLQFGQNAPLLWVAAIDTFVLSMVLIVLKEWSRSLWPSIVVHFIKNSLAYVSMFVVR